MSTLIILFVVLTLLVLVHEWGHFIVARRAGIEVEEFGFGFPPRLFGIQRGKTMYSINWIPLGGFVRLKGEAGERAKDADSFAQKSAGVKLGVIIAGICMNFILAWALLTVGYVAGLPQLAEQLPSYAHVSNAQLQVLDVLKGSPAADAHLQQGDSIVSIDGIVPSDLDQFRSYVTGKNKVPVIIEISRENVKQDITVIPRAYDSTNVVGVGVALARIGIVSYSPLRAPVIAAQTVWWYISDIAISLRDILALVFRGHGGQADVSGPVGIAVATSQVAKMGWRYVLQFTALLSVNLGFINLLPFPGLDGGRAAFVIAGLVRGRAVERQFEAIINTAGFALLVALLMFVTYHDLLRFGGGILGAIGFGK